MSDPTVSDIDFKNKMSLNYPYRLQKGENIQLKFYSSLHLSFNNLYVGVAAAYF